MSEGCYALVEVFVIQSLGGTGENHFILAWVAWYDQFRFNGMKYVYSLGQVLSERQTVDDRLSCITGQVGHCLLIN